MTNRWLQPSSTQTMLEPWHDDARVEVVPHLSQSFSAKPYRYMLVAIDVFTKKVAAVPLASKTAPTAAAAWNQIVKALGVPSYVYSDDGSEFKSEFKQKLDYFDVDKVVSRGHAYFVERAIRTLKEALLRRISAGGPEQVAPATARRPSAVQQQNSRRHGSRSQPSLLGSCESRTCQASHADAGQEKRSPSTVPGSG